MLNIFERYLSIWMSLYGNAGRWAVLPAVAHCCHFSRLYNASESLSDSHFAPNIDLKFLSREVVRSCAIFSFPNNVPSVFCEQGRLVCMYSRIPYRRSSDRLPGSYEPIRSHGNLKFGLPREYGHSIESPQGLACLAGKNRKMSTC